MFDADYNPFILEFNADPFLKTSTKVTKKITPNLIKEMLDLEIFL